MRFKKISKLRAKLYIGMLPVVGILTLICLFFIYNQSKQLNRLDELQNTHYSATSAIEKLLLAVSQMERILAIRETSDADLLIWIQDSSKTNIETWLAKTRESGRDPDQFGESTLMTLLVEFLSESKLVIDGTKKADADAIHTMTEKIEDAAINSIALHNDRIIEINKEFKNQAEYQYIVVVIGIISSVIVMGIVAYLLSQRILMPIDSLTQAAMKMTEDNWETDYQSHSSDEIAMLEIAFIEMAARMREYNKITSRKMIQIRRRMEACFDRLPHPVMFVDASHKLIYQNPAATRLIQALGDVDTFPPRLKTSIENVFKTGEHILPTEFEETIAIKIENEEEYFLPIVIRIDGKDQNYVECALILQNVTDLRLSDELKSDLVATVSHEIKTPVTSASMALHLLLEKGLGDLNEDQEDMVETARSDLERLKRILNHLLQIARIEKTESLSKARISLEPLFQAVIEAHAMAAQEKSITILKTIDEALPPVYADQDALEVVLSNFLSNAVKYSPEDSRVEMYARPSDGGIRLGILDEGPGLPEDDSEKVFEKFYRSPKQKQAGGVGLGLSIVRDIAFAHNGTAGHNNRSSGGSDFWMELPLL